MEDVFPELRQREKFVMEVREVEGGGGGGGGGGERRRKESTAGLTSVVGLGGLVCVLLASC